MGSADSRGDVEGPVMKAAIIAGCVVLSVLSAAPGAHAQIDLGSPLSPLLRPRIWNCGSTIVLVEPNDPMWKSDKANFTRGTLRMAIRNGHLTFELSEKVPIAKCVRQPVLAGDTLRSTYFLQDLSLSLVF